ncbi:endonuclease/exonuclease/phosphatase family protein [Clostridium perfringens]|uniref:endonuclease/exonuclease/phosphatase family protein n=1 Tax=Clostridium perfringens TaxID=1502 RepID=UPI001A19BDCA|nr:endonuclease/exonuclease/phosphatase family protein [Clostridium perfringens]MDC4244958.1 endonuclease/exonuclease/phosphatase family protein [Clostridium perfringens]HAT4321680.1 endonuclease/exonuclease/phosphatase family protein [Clostridium perfringens]HAT4331460.1 endonuclease/exonuclease/phosphatase family protein [Clostridium perfringens]
MRNLKVMTFNLKYDFKAQDNNEWSQRCLRITKLIKDHLPDIIGTQEGLIHMLNDMDDLLDEYSWVGEDREGNGKDEFNAIFFLKNKFEVLEWNQFWLSKTPNIKGSKDFNSSLPRICTKLKLKDKISGLKIDIYNTHLDHESELAREEGIKIILKEVKKNYKIYKTPYIIMGDFNCYLEDNLFNIIREEETNNTCFNVCYDNIKNNILGTFHYFKGGYDGRIIDYILYSKECEIKSLNIDDRKINEGYPSDHYPVICELELK